MGAIAIDPQARGLAAGAKADAAVVRDAAGVANDGTLNFVPAWSAATAAASKYGVGAVVRRASGGYWRNTVAGNKTNPDSATYDGWEPFTALVQVPDRAFARRLSRPQAIPQCALRLSSAPTVPNNTPTILSWSLENADQYNMHDTVTNPDRITIPAGFSQRTQARVVAVVKWPAMTGATGTRQAWIMKNGFTTIAKDVRIAVTEAGTETICHLDTGLVDCKPTDFFNVYVQHTQGVDTLVPISVDITRFELTIEGVRSASGSNAGVLFDANIAMQGVSAFAGVYPPASSTRVRQVDDPIYGGDRQVLELWPRQQDNQLFYPRVQLQTSSSLAPNSNVYAGLAIYIPPDLPSLTGLNTCVIHEFYGPPTSGHGPNVLCIVDNNLTLCNQAIYDPNTGLATGAQPIWSKPLDPLKGRWIGIVNQVLLSTDPATGYHRIWLDTGNGLVAQTFTNGSTTFNQATLKAGVNDGGNNFGSLKVAWNNPVGVPPSITDLRMLYCEYRLGTSLAAVAPSLAPPFA